MLSLERTDLWDSRPFEGLDQARLNYPWVSEQLFLRDTVSLLHYTGGLPHTPGCTKLPAGVLTFSNSEWGTVKEARFEVAKAITRLEWQNGTVLESFVHPEQPIGWFRLTHLSAPAKPIFIRPPFTPDIEENIYEKAQKNILQRLQYVPGVLIEEYDHYRYQQPGYEDESFEVSIRWKRENAHTLTGVWSITQKKGHYSSEKEAMMHTRLAMRRGFEKDLRAHQEWWRRYYEASSVTLPDQQLMHHWNMAQYELGISIRAGGSPVPLAPPVGLANAGAVSRSGFDVTIQGSAHYWGACTANHLEQSQFLCQYFSENINIWKRFTKKYYGVQGLSLPGNIIPDGAPAPEGMPYTLSPTSSAVVAQLFYQHWRYSMDRTFLQQQAWPWLHETAIFLENWSNMPVQSTSKVGYSPQARHQPQRNWYKGWTNYELALVHFVYQATAELAQITGRENEAQKWVALDRQLPPFLTDKNTGGLLVAEHAAWNPADEYPAHLVALYPLRLPLPEHPKSRGMITAGRATLEQGMSDSASFAQRAWLALLKVREYDGAGAIEALQMPALTLDTICLSIVPGPCCPENSALLSIILQEMLLQSYKGYIEVMPAIPPEWQEVSFRHLRAEGAFLISAERAGGQVDRIELRAEKGGKTVIKLPFRTWYIAENEGVTYFIDKKGYMRLQCQEGGHIIIRNGYE